MVGINDIAHDRVNFRDREGGSGSGGNPDGVPPKRALSGHTEQQLYGSSWAVAETKNH